MSVKESRGSMERVARVGRARLMIADEVEDEVSDSGGCGCCLGPRWRWVWVWRGRGGMKAGMKAEEIVIVATATVTVAVPKILFLSLMIVLPTSRPQSPKVVNLNQHKNGQREANHREDG